MATVVAPAYPVMATVVLSRSISTALGGISAFVPGRMIAAAMTGVAPPNPPTTGQLWPLNGS